MSAFFVSHRLALSGLLVLSAAAPVHAQQNNRAYYNQDALAQLMYEHRDSLETLPEVTYRIHIVDHPSGNSIRARHALYAAVGGGDAERGRESLAMTAFLNRIEVGRLGIGDTVVVPSTVGLDPRAYAPFPRIWEGAREAGKVLVIHKGVQAWAAYEHGRLERWGLVNTGMPGHRTPAGRFNVNWQTPERISSESPEGEEWLMRWVTNFHAERGIHLHQYRLPTGPPASHGCVRTMMADARWIYDWVEPWQTTAGRGALGGRLQKAGSLVLVLGEGEEPDGPPQRFEYNPEGPRLRIVALPDDPYEVPPGTAQQRRLDQQRDG